MIDETANIDERQLIIPGLAGLYRCVAPLGYAVIRIAIGLIMLGNGVDKVFHGGAARIATGNVTQLGLPAPYAWAWTVAGAEFFGGILIVIGLFTRPVAVAWTIILTVVAFWIMIKRGMFWHTGGIEVALLLLAISVALLIGGSGRYSVDRLIGREF